MALPCMYPQQIQALSASRVHHSRIRERNGYGHLDGERTPNGFRMLRDRQDSTCSPERKNWSPEILPPGGSGGAVGGCPGSVPSTKWPSSRSSNASEASHSTIRLPRSAGCSAHSRQQRRTCSRATSPRARSARSCSRSPTAWRSCAILIASIRRSESFAARRSDRRSRGPDRS